MVPIPSSNEDRTAPPAAPAREGTIPTTDPLGTLQASNIPIATYVGPLTNDNNSLTLHVSSSQQQQPGMARVMQRPETRLEQANARLVAEMTVRDLEIELLTTELAASKDSVATLQSEIDRLREENAALKASKGAKATRKVRDRSRRPSHNEPIRRKNDVPYDMLKEKVRSITSCHNLSASPFCISSPTTRFAMLSCLHVHGTIYKRLLWISWAGMIGTTPTSQETSTKYPESKLRRCISLTTTTSKNPNASRVLTSSSESSSCYPDPTKLPFPISRKSFRVSFKREASLCTVPTLFTPFPKRLRRSFPAFTTALSSTKTTTSKQRTMGHGTRSRLFGPTHFSHYKNFLVAAAIC
jgi:hypothetical protein